MTRRGALAGAGAGALAPAARAQRARPLVYAHRGASALRPEHTLASYAKAIADGADFIEPDLVATKDGALVARHEPDIHETTDVAQHPEFADRRRTVQFDGRTVTGWFACDFTLAELKTLRCRERLGAAIRPESASYDGRFQIVSFEEMIDFVAAESATRGRLIGIVPELKSSTWHAAQGRPIDALFVRTVERSAYAQRAPLHVQSFEIDNLKALRRRWADRSNVRLVQLIGAPSERPVDTPSTTYGAMASPAGLQQVAAYAHVLAPPLPVVVPPAAGGRLGTPSPVTRDAHAAGLKVVAWTFRPENRFLPVDLRDGPPDARNPRGSMAEMRRHLEAGIDGFFTDDPAIGRTVADAWAAA